MNIEPMLGDIVLYQPDGPTSLVRVGVITGRRPGQSELTRGHMSADVWLFEGYLGDKHVPGRLVEDVPNGDMLPAPRTQDTTRKLEEEKQS